MQGEEGNGDEEDDDGGRAEELDERDWARGCKVLIVVDDGDGGRDVLITVCLVEEEGFFVVMVDGFDWLGDVLERRCFLHPGVGGDCDKECKKSPSALCRDGGIYFARPFHLLHHLNNDVLESAKNRAKGQNNG